jgi:hypothetical protein
VYPIEDGTFDNYDRVAQLESLMHISTKIQFLRRVERLYVQALVSSLISNPSRLDCLSSPLRKVAQTARVAEQNIDGEPNLAQSPHERRREARDGMDRRVERDVQPVDRELHIDALLGFPQR